MAGFHLVTDLDGTWLPAPGQVVHLRRLEAAVAASPGAVLTFATGRTFASVQEAMDRWSLRPPHHLICDVGTGLFHRLSTGAWVEDAAWAGRVAGAWDVEAAERVERNLPPGVAAQPGVRPRHRLALQVQAGCDLTTAAAGLRDACRNQGLAADLLPSHGLYLDVLPPGVHKGAALEFLQVSSGLPRPVVGCGDSANDLSLFEVSDHPVLMQDGLGDHEAPSWLLHRAHRTLVPGPQGIHRALIAFGLLEEDGHGH